MSLDQTWDLVSGELWLLVPVEEEACMHSRHGAKAEGTLFQPAVSSDETAQEISYHNRLRILDVPVLFVLS